MDANRPILLVEDDQVDALTVKIAFKKLNIKNELINVENGEKALEYLNNQNSVKPCLILLDINMPKMNGFEFLKVFRSDEKINFIPVVIVTTSKQDQDKRKMFDYSVSGYMIKPIDYDVFLNTVYTIKSYWSLSKFPPIYQ